MTVTVNKNKYGPFWTLGLTTVTTAGTPVNIGALVSADASTDSTTEYTDRVSQLILQGCRAGASHGVTTSTGNVYVILKGGTRDDFGQMLAVIPPSQFGVMFKFPEIPLLGNGIGLEQVYIDADTAGDGVVGFGVITS